MGSVLIINFHGLWIIRTVDGNIHFRSQRFRLEKALRKTLIEAGEGRLTHMDLRSFSQQYHAVSAVRAPGGNKPCAIWIANVKFVSVRYYRQLVRLLFRNRQYDQIDVTCERDIFPGVF
jgi:hypothetical protein